MSQTVSSETPGALVKSTPVAASATPQTFHRDIHTGLAALPALGSSPLQLDASWEPMQGLPEFYAEPEYGKLLATLKPGAPRIYKSSSFLPFLPAKAVQLGATFPIPSDAVAVGTTWALPMNAMSRFLQQLHPSATTDILTDAPGAYAVLRARSKDRWEIDFRIHAQLQVVDRVWMTPSQFQGRLLVNLEQGKVEFAEFRVPVAEDGRPNVAMDTARGSALAGVGVLPNMSLVGGDKSLLESAQWVEQISPAQAELLLKRQFYAFEQAEWSPLKVALARASIEHKPLLAVVVAGPLDDQAC